MTIKDFHDKKVDIEDDEIVALFKGTFGDKNYAEYVGGSLCYDYNDRILTFTVGDKNLSDEANYWLAKLYLKHKNERCSYWKRSQDIVAAFRISVL